MIAPIWPGRKPLRMVALQLRRHSSRAFGGSSFGPTDRACDQPIGRHLGGVPAFDHPSAILALPALVSRMPPKTSSMYPSSISRTLCSEGMRCIKPLAPSRNETNSSRVNGGAVGAIFLVCACGCSNQPGKRCNMRSGLLPASGIRFRGRPVRRQPWVSLASDRQISRKRQAN
jgi:hypothetical protein